MRVISAILNVLWCYLLVLQKLSNERSYNKLAPTIFQEKFRIYKHKYQSRRTQNFYLPEAKSKNSEFKISYRGPNLWNNVLSKEQKMLTSVHTLKTSIQKQLHNNNNELNFY